MIIVIIILTFIDYIELHGTTLRSMYYSILITL